MATPHRSQLRELVDSPNESLEVEYKLRLDLDDGIHRADLARHIAAMANYGGGAIVFGFSDEMRPVSEQQTVIDRDVVSGIVKRYLEPTFQCEVVSARSSIGTEHPIILVPPHGPSPICARANGPEVKGRPSGIVQGAYYLRKPGPASEPITTSNEWSAVIRRCVMHERSSLLSAIGAALSGAEQRSDTEVDLLTRWHDAAHQAFLLLAHEPNRFPNLSENHWQGSYFISSAREPISAARLPSVLREVNGEVRDLVRSGWSMFHQFSQQSIVPYFAEDPNAGVGERDFLECALLREQEIEGADFWRVFPDGRATIIREFWEDVLYQREPARHQPGTRLSPFLLTQSLAELVRHARGLAERFDGAVSVSFRCEWWGLEGRTAGDGWSRGFSGQQSHTDHRIAVGSWPITSLNSGLAEIVAELGSPVARALGIGEMFTSQWVESQRLRWNQ